MSLLLILDLMVFYMYSNDISCCISNVTFEIDFLFPFDCYRLAVTVWLLPFGCYCLAVTV